MNKKVKSERERERQRKRRDEKSGKGDFPSLNFKYAIVCRTK